MKTIGIKLRNDFVYMKKWSKGIKRFIDSGLRNYKGGNGQTPTKFIQEIEKRLLPYGFVREVGISTKDNQSPHQNVPFAYKVDFANKETKTVIEFDGPYHKHYSKLDQKKNEVLESMGWEVIRIKHDRYGHITPLPI